MLIQIVIGAGQRVRFAEAGDFFRILESTGAVDLDFFRQGREVADSYGVSAGYAEKFAGGFDAFDIYSAAGATIRFAARLGNEVSFDAPPTGAVTVGGEVRVAGSAVAFSQAAATVTTASAMMLAAGATRRYLTVQNKSATGTIYVNVAGAAATTANGIRLRPGESVEFAGVVPSGAIYAIGDIASNPDVVYAYG